MQLTDKQFRLLQLGLEELAKAMGVRVLTVTHHPSVANVTSEGDSVTVVFQEKEKDETSTTTGLPSGTGLASATQESQAALPTESGEAAEDTQPSPSVQPLPTESEPSAAIQI
jgi:hypothetical protein